MVHNRSDTTIKGSKGTVVQLGKGTREHAIRAESAYHPLDTCDDVPHRAHRPDRRRAAQGRIDGMQAIVDAR